MEKLMEYTGGNIVITIAAMCLATIGLLFGTIALLKKAKNTNHTRRFEYVVYIISIIILTVVISGTVGYYLGVLKML